jgi:hypothetical protein
MDIILEGLEVLRLKRPLKKSQKLSFRAKREISLHCKSKKKRDSSAKIAPRNNKVSIFSVASEARATRTWVRFSVVEKLDWD